MLKKVTTLLAWVICFVLASSSFAESSEINLQSEKPTTSPPNIKKYGYLIRINVYEYYKPNFNVDVIRFSSKGLKFQFAKSSLKSKHIALYWSLRKGAKCIDFELNRTESYIKFCKSWNYEQVLDYLGKFELVSNNESLAKFKLHDEDNGFYRKNKKSILDCRKYFNPNYLLAKENVSWVCISDDYVINPELL